VGALAWTFVGLTVVCVSAVAHYDGGLASGAVFWLVVAPLFGSFLGGSRLGWAAAAASAASGLAMYAASRAGYVFPVSLGPEDAAVHYAINFGMAVASVAAVAALYEGPMVRHFRELSGRLAATNGRLQDELVERQRAQRRAESASRAKDALLGTMSHEFRTPLTAILSGAELLLDEADDDDRPVLQTIDRGAQRLLGTLDGVLRLTALESGGLTLRPARVDVAAEVEAAAGPFREAAARKGLALDVGAFGAVAHVDPAALRRVLAALLDNAVRFTERGRVAVTAWADGEGVAVEVVDTGVGMTETFLARAAEPFQQASDGDARTHEGLGLGLTVAYRLVGMMGGGLSVESEVGGGTVVRVRLPSAVGAEPARPAVEA
jgi:signal transduction histidine kinase